MNHADHVALIRGGVSHQGGTWADFGSGTGAFTLALAELIGPAGSIYSIDKSKQSLRRQAENLNSQFPETNVEYITADFTRPLDLPVLDGAVMANALHFLRRKDNALQLINGYLRPGGQLIMVEYNVDRGNLWVPYPLSFSSWQNLAGRNGFVETRLLATRPSRFLHEIYAAVSQKPPDPR